MPDPMQNPREAEFWNGTMGHAWVSEQAVISDIFTSITSVSLIRATEAARNALAANIGADGRGLHVALSLVSAST